MSSSIIIEERSFGAIARAIFVAFTIPSLIILSYILLILSDNYPNMVVSNSVTNTSSSAGYTDTSLSNALAPLPNDYKNALILIESYHTLFSSTQPDFTQTADVPPQIKALKNIATNLKITKEQTSDILTIIHDLIKNKKYIDLFTTYYFNYVNIKINDTDTTLKTHYDTLSNAGKTQITDFITNTNSVSLDVFKTPNVSTSPSVDIPNSTARCIANENTMKTVEKSLIVILFLQSCILGLFVIPFIIHFFKSMGQKDDKFKHFFSNLSNHGVFHKSKNSSSSSLWWNGSFLFAFLSSIVIIGFGASLFKKFKNRQTYYTYSPISGSNLQTVKDNLEINRSLYCVQFNSESDLKNHWNGALTCIIFVSIQLFLFTGIISREDRDLKNIVTEVGEISDIAKSINALSKEEIKDVLANIQSRVAKKEVANKTDTNNQSVNDIQSRGSKVEVAEKAE